MRSFVASLPIAACVACEALFPTTLATTPDDGGSPDGQDVTDASPPFDATDSSAEASHVPDAPAESTPEAAAPIPELLVLTHGSTGVDDLILVDVAKQSAVRDQSLVGGVDLFYASGKVYVPCGSGQTRLLVLDATTLALEQTIVLPVDPVATAFAPGATAMFALDATGGITGLTLPSAAPGPVASLTPPPDAGGTPIPSGLALDRAGTHLAATAYFDDTSGISLFSVSPTTLTLDVDVQSSPVSGCDRQAGLPSFSPDSLVLATFDTNCETYDMVNVATGQLASTSFTRAGEAGSGAIVWDASSQVWSINDTHLYRLNEMGPSPAAFDAPSETSGGLTTDDTGTILYFMGYDPHTTGAATIDRTTGAATALPWNLALVPEGSSVVKMIYARAVTASQGD
jgi:DNA-binding beta-propeller fold protein YncE